MNNLTYLHHKSWSYPPDLISQIVAEIKIFYANYNKEQLSQNRIPGFNNEPAFAPLLVHIKLISGADKSDIPSLGWLQDFYNGSKKSKKIKKCYFETLLKTFKYNYNPEDDSFEKDLNVHTNEDKTRLKKLEIIDFINLRAKKSLQLKEFVGVYKYFVGGRKEDTIYDYIYENELEIFSNGQVEIRNPFNSHTFYGYAVLTTTSSLQIISYNFDEGLLDGVGNIMTFSINKYSRFVRLIPGLGLTFDADGRPIATQTLLCTDLTQNKKSEMIREYFDDVISHLRLYCPTTGQVEKLVVKHYS